MSQRFLAILPELFDVNVKKIFVLLPTDFLAFFMANPPLYIYNDATLTIIEKIIKFAWAIFSKLGLCPILN